MHVNQIISVRMESERKFQKTDKRSNSHYSDKMNAALPNLINRNLQFEFKLLKKRSSNGLS